LIRMSFRVASLAALVALSLPALQSAAQQMYRPLPPRLPRSRAHLPLRPPLLRCFPRLIRKLYRGFAAKEAVNAFLSASWGYDEARIWQVQAIQKPRSRA